jgi:hypothetical protein
VLLSVATDKWQQFGTLRNVKHVEEPTTGRILVHLEATADPDLVVDDLIRMIAGLGVRVRGVTLLSPSLDEIYYRYVQLRERSA